MKVQDSGVKCEKATEVQNKVVRDEVEKEKVKLEGIRSVQSGRKGKCYGVEMLKSE